MIAVIIMTDRRCPTARIIATLLMTFFFQEMPRHRAQGASVPGPASALPTDGRQGEPLRPRRYSPGGTGSHGCFKGKKRRSQPVSRAWVKMNPQQIARKPPWRPKTRGLIRITLPQEFEERAGRGAALF